MLYEINAMFNDVSGPSAQGQLYSTSRRLETSVQFYKLFHESNRGI
jgi:hypothetical protein